MRTFGSALIWFVASLTVASCGGGGGGEISAPPPPPPPSGPTAAQLASAAQLLDRTTFGADYAQIDATARAGNDAWLDQQFTMPATNHLPIVQRYLNHVLDAALSQNIQIQAVAIDVLSFTIKQGLAHPLQVRRDDTCIM